MSKKAKLESYLYSVLDAIDKTGANTARYREYFSGMSEEQFQAAMKEFLLDDEEHIFVELDQFDNNLTIADIKAAGEIAGVLLEDYLVLPHVSDDKENPYVTNEKVMVGWIPKRRVQQAVSVKNHLSTSIDKRNPKTGQVIDDDKNARVSDSETNQLIFQNSPNVLYEFFNPKADDMTMKNEMLYQIQRKGSVSLDELVSSPENKVSLNYLNFLFLAAGYETNLIDANGLLPIVAARGGKLYKDI